MEVRRGGRSEKREEYSYALFENPIMNGIRLMSSNPKGDAKRRALIRDRRVAQPSLRTSNFPSLITGKSRFSNGCLTSNEMQRIFFWVVYFFRWFDFLLFILICPFFCFLIGSVEF